MDNGDTGAIFPNKAKKSQEQPDFTGTIEISKDLMAKLVRTVQGGGEAKIRVAGWKNQSKAGNGYVRLRVSEDTYHEGAPKAENQRAQFKAEGNGGRSGYENRRAPAPQGTPPWEMDL